MGKIRSNPLLLGVIIGIVAVFALMLLFRRGKGSR